MKTILAIDQSTSGTKVILFNDIGEIITSKVKNHRQIYPQSGWVEHDAEEIWQNLLEISRELLIELPALSLPEFISITNQRETVLVFDRKTGKPLTNAFVWQCTRGADICQEYQDRNYSEIIRTKTGLKIDTYFSASKLTWLIRNHPELKEKITRGEALIGTMDTYLIYRLTSGKTFATDVTNASRTLLYNIHELSWDEELSRIFEVPRSALAEVRDSASTFGETILNGLLKQPIPICGVIGDSQASLFAQRCFTPGTIKATFGTGTSVMLNIGKTTELKDPRLMLALAWSFNGEPIYAIEGLINYSAATLEWLKNQLGLINSNSEIESLSHSVHDNGGVYLVPAFSGLGAPYWNPHARAAIWGMSAGTHKGHIIRAALESIAYQLKDNLDMLTQATSIPLEKLHADGGASQNDQLMQFIADLCQVEISVQNFGELSALGAAFMGMLAMNWIKSPAEINSFPQSVQSYKPCINNPVMQKYYAGWKHAVYKVNS